MANPHELACRLLKLEQQLRAYEKLHAGELSELWKNLNECKQAVADIVSSDEPDRCDRAKNPEPPDHPTERTAAQHH